MTPGMAIVASASAAFGIPPDQFAIVFQPPVPPVQVVAIRRSPFRGAAMIQVMSSWGYILKQILSFGLSKGKYNRGFETGAHFFYPD
jgi:hypothetical protein